MNIGKVMIEYLFPRHCPICDKVMENGLLICPECVKKVQLIEGKRCKKCSKSFQDDMQDVCYDCRRQMHQYKQGYALFEYHSIVDSLYRFKYSERSEYAEYYGTMIATCMEKIIRSINPDFMIPVPLHKNKQRKRGYNQAELVAKCVGKILDISVLVDYIERVKDTRPQKLLSGAKRENNVKKAFHIVRNDVKLKRVIIIDDIYTTGSTINEMVRELNKNQVVEVFFITIAIGKGF